jgi:hypothetical protein
VAECRLCIREMTFEYENWNMYIVYLASSWTSLDLELIVIVDVSRKCRDIETHRNTNFVLHYYIGISYIVLNSRPRVLSKGSVKGSIHRISNQGMGRRRRLLEPQRCERKGTHAKSAPENPGVNYLSTHTTMD